MRAAQAYGKGMDMAGYGKGMGYGMDMGYGYPGPGYGKGMGGYGKGPWDSSWGATEMLDGYPDQLEAPSGASQNAAAKALQALKTAGGGSKSNKLPNKRTALRPPGYEMPEDRLVPPTKAHLPATSLVQVVEKKENGKVKMERAEDASIKVISGSDKGNMTHKRFVGRIKRFDPLNGYGFIQCQETFKAYGRDVFLNQAVSGGVPAVGNTVSFNIEVNEKGQPQARDTILEMPTGSAQARDASPTRGGDAEAKEPAHNPVLGKVYRGRIKSYNPGHGFGFIDCEDTYRYFHRDVFLHPNQLTDGMTIGSEVEFMVTLNKNQQPQARDIRVPEILSRPPGLLNPPSAGIVYDPLTAASTDEGSVKLFR